MWRQLLLACVSCTVVLASVVDHPTRCPNNEVYYNCSGDCVPRKCSELGFPLNCKEKCIPGCVCKDNYMRNDCGICIHKNDCPSCGDDENAVSGCSNYCGQRCSDYGKPPIPCPQFCMFNGCNCRKGFYWDFNVRKCVKPIDCTPTCPVNEAYSFCTNGGCDARNCSQLGKPVPCVKIDPKYCIKGCVCVEDYLRAKNGTCVPKDQCNTKPCGTNEVYNSCINGYCGHRNCSELGGPIKCVDPPLGGCIGGCVCADGYLREDNGTCVPEKECAPMCGLHEQYSFCNNGGCGHRNCSQIGKLVLCIDPIPSACIKGCICVDGYLRDYNGKCVPEKECPTKCIGENEYFETCIEGCSNQTCGSIGQMYFCPFQNGCKSGCRCKPGYYRKDIVSPCSLTKEECTKQCSRNEHWDKCFFNCGGHNQTCDDIGKSWSCPGQVKCQSGCRCDKGYWRDKHGRCIPEKECPQKCGKHEHWDTCYLNCGVGQNCDDIGKNWTCPKEPKCQIGCRCDVGYWRNKHGECIPEKQCRIQRCSKNEYWEPCIQDCRNQSCNLLGKPAGSCPGRPAGQCNSGCRCLPKHYRDWTGTCITENECPRCEQQNEEWEHCIQDCAKQTCEEYITGKVNQCPRPGGICPGGSGCRCRHDAYRNATGYCVWKEQCRNTTSISTTTKPPSTEKPSTGGGNGLSGLLDGITSFTGECLYDRMQSLPDENIIMSAMSIFTPMAELCLYSDGPAQEQCLKKLNLKNKQDIRDTFAQFATLYEDVNSVNFSTAAKVYCNKNYQLSDGFKKDAVAVFHAEAQELDFSKNTEAANVINAWVESKTNNRINNLITPDMLSALVRTVLVNAIYFKGNWLYRFNETDTKEEDFYRSDGSTSKAKLMYLKIKDLDYGVVPSLNCKVVRIYYTGKDSSMIVALPDSINGTMALAKALQERDNWKKLLDSLSPQKVKLYLPKFVISTSTNLKELLQKAGITKWFDCNDSGLTGILKKPENICVSAALQKAWCEVTEIGTEAAAADGVVASPGRPSPPILPLVFKADHSFLFYIVLKSTNIPIFCGKYGKPN